MLADKSCGTYRVTGKIDQLYAVLQFLDENKVIPDAEINDREADGDDGDLFDVGLEPGNPEQKNRPTDE